MQATSPPPLDSGKAAWRKWLRARTEPEPGKASAAIVRELATLLKSLPASRIAAFAGMPDEPDLWPLIESTQGHEWFLPRISETEMNFHAMQSRHDGIPGVFGIIEPHTSAARIDAPEIDLVLCPGLGFGRDLSRIGRGKGYYDRWLSRLRPGTPIIGVAFPCRIVDAVPTDAHDIRMTQLIPSA